MTTGTREACYGNLELWGPLSGPICPGRTTIRPASSQAFPRPPLHAALELASPEGSSSVSFLSVLWVSPSFPFCGIHLTVYLCLHYQVTMGTLDCYSVDLQCVPKDSSVEVLVPSLWHYRELVVALIGGSLVDGSYWGISLEVIKGHSPFSLLSQLSGPSFHVLCAHGLQPLTLSSMHLSSS